MFFLNAYTDGCVYTLNSPSSCSGWSIPVPSLHGPGKKGSERLSKLLNITQLANTQRLKTRACSPGPRPIRLEYSAGKPGVHHPREGGAAGPCRVSGAAQGARLRRARALGLRVGARGGREDGGGERARGDVPGAMLEGWW